MNFLSHSFRLSIASWGMALLFAYPTAHANRYFLLGVRAAQTKSVPGGILFPDFSRAGEINAATIPWDWGGAAELLYSPSTRSKDSQGVSASFTRATSSRMGFSAGYVGSLYDQATQHGAFAGFGARFHALSVGVTVRIPAVDKLDTETAVDASAVFKPNALLDWGVTLRSMKVHPVLIGGIGVGRYNAFNLEINLEVPLYPISEDWMARYQAVVSASLKILGTEWGLVATQATFPTGETSMRYTAAGTLWLATSWGIKTEYNTEHSAYSIGLCFFSEPATAGSRRVFTTGRSR